MVSSVNPALLSAEYFFNRELSWLEFNRRVLHEAMDERTPLLERLKFTAIFSSNLDEYFMVRVAALKQQAQMGVQKRSPDGMTAAEQLSAISDRLRPLVTQQHQHFHQQLRTQLANRGIYLVDYIDLNQKQRLYLQGYFEEHIFPVLTPLAVDPGHPFPYISNLSLSLAVLIKDEETDVEHFARVKVPKVLPRFIEFPPELQVRRRGKATLWSGIPLEQAIAHNLEALFPGMIIQEYYPFRITRDRLLELAEDEADDLLVAIEQELHKQRGGGEVIRMEVPVSMPEPMRDRLMQELGLQPDAVYPVEGLLCLRDLFALTELPAPDLKDAPWSPIIPPQFPRSLDYPNGRKLDSDEDLFALLRKQDLLVHHPYHSFKGTVERFITQAAHDPAVLAIKMTLYRTSGDSPIIDALIDAAMNGKQVAVLVEIKARFDEANNIQWARKLEKVGIHVVYGLVGLKTHTKVVLVVRQEQHHIRRYVHIGTGNYNPKTARSYTDLGLLSGRDDLGADLTDLFNYLTGYSRQRSYRRLLVAPVNLRDRMVALIRQEIKQVRNGNHGRIVLKMNALTDPVLIAALYEASQAGVKIDLVVRGICCLRPGLEEISENIRVISIIGRFLEHSRIFYFHNGGDEKLFIGSADWMQRNLDRRVEAVTPIEDPAIARDLQEILGVLLSDNRHAWELQSDGSYMQYTPEAPDAAQSAQATLMEMALQSIDMV